MLGSIDIRNQILCVSMSPRQNFCYKQFRRSSKLLFEVASCKQSKKRICQRNLCSLCKQGSRTSAASCPAEVCGFTFVFQFKLWYTTSSLETRSGPIDVEPVAFPMTIGNFEFSPVCCRSRTWRRRRRTTGCEGGLTPVSDRQNP